ncbi:MAG TPA: hypothetical protein PLY93_03475 [Turneriella sp.]|nr:hypothetical protein [Turneriella sp.]
MKRINFYLILLLFSNGCITQEPIGIIFTENGVGAGIASGMVEKTITTAPATISSITNAIGSSMILLEFTVKENGSRDGYPLQINSL